MPSDTRRFCRLISIPGGLHCLLSTFNYTLYLLVYFESKSAPLRARLQALILKTRGITAPSMLKAGVVAPSRIAALASLLSSTRTTLRLFGLFPMYAGFRQLMQGPKPGDDHLLHATRLTQCSLYMMFQFLENVALLTDVKVLPTSYTARWTASADGKTQTIYRWAYRAWMAGFCCDFVRLAREAQLEQKRRSVGRKNDVASIEIEQEKEFDRKWWADMLVPMSWFPVGAQFAFEDGMPGFNLGIMGLCGLMANLRTTTQLWARTADV